MKSLMTAIFTIAIFLASVTAADAQQCYVFVKNNGGGNMWTVKAGKSYKFVGSKWNDRISSIYVLKGYKIVLYTHRDFNGRSEVFTGEETVDSRNKSTHLNLDEYNFNDAVSSFKCLRQ